MLTVAETCAASGVLKWEPGMMRTDGRVYLGVVDEHHVWYDLKAPGLLERSPTLRGCVPDLHHAGTVGFIADQAQKLWWAHGFRFVVKHGSAGVMVTLNQDLTWFEETEGTCWIKCLLDGARRFLGTS